MKSLILTLMLVIPTVLFAQEAPPIKPGVSLELAKWRAAQYSDVRYKLNLTLERMSPVLKGTMEIRLKVKGPSPARRVGQMPPEGGPIILDWRSIAGHEKDSVISNVTLSNDLVKNQRYLPDDQMPIDHLGGGVLPFEMKADHLIFTYGVVAGENVIKLDFTSPILTSGSAITRYVDKEDGSEYIYSLFVPSNASTAFPVFDQPDLKARFGLFLSVPDGWTAIGNTPGEFVDVTVFPPRGGRQWKGFNFKDTKPISTYVFAFAAGTFTEIGDPLVSGIRKKIIENAEEGKPLYLSDDEIQNEPRSRIYVRKSQAAKFAPHAAEVFRLNREAVKYFEQYFDYKFPFPKYDLVLIQEFPSAGKGSAGLTFLRESSILLSQEPTKNDLSSRKALIFDQAKNQWSGEKVPVRTK